MAIFRLPEFLSSWQHTAVSLVLDVPSVNGCLYEIGQVLAHANHIFILKNGYLVDSGTYKELRARCPEAIEHSSELPSNSLTEAEETPTGRVAPANELLDKPADAGSATNLDSRRRDGSWGVYSYYYQTAGTIPVLLWFIFTLIEALCINLARKYPPMR
jgi:hypothetical protein